MTGSQKQQRDKLLHWCKPYPPIVTAMAMISAKSAETLHLACDWAINGYPTELSITAYDEPKFWEYYAHPHRLAAELIHSFAEEGDNTASQIERELDCLPKLAKRRVREAFRNASWSDLIRGRRIGKRFWRRELNRLATWIVLPDNGEEYDDEFLSLMAHPATAFLLQIAAPHWLLFGRWPQESFRLASRAERPNKRILNQLVMLDPLVVHHLRLRAVLNPADLRLRNLLPEIGWYEVLPDSSARLRHPSNRVACQIAHRDTPVPNRLDRGDSIAASRGAVLRIEPLADVVRSQGVRFERLGQMFSKPRQERQASLNRGSRTVHRQPVAVAIKQLKSCEGRRSLQRASHELVELLKGCLPAAA